VTPRHIALALAAVAVFGLGLYLYVAVNSTTPAVANVRQGSAAPTPNPEDRAADAPAHPTPTETVADKPARTNAALRDAGGVAPRPEVATNPGAGIDIKKDELMASANKAYDHGEFDEAIVIARKVLSNEPGNVRMLRIMVSSSCINDDADTARKNYLLLPANGNDRADMRKRCDRYGITFSEM
jgi:hypothetical protein